MDKEQFVELYLNADEEVKETICRILEEELSLLELPDLPLKIIYTSK